MPKQILSSFKELRSLLSDVPTSKKLKTNKTPKRATKKQTRSKPIPTIKPSKSVEPRLQAIFDALNWLKTTFPLAFVNPPTLVKPLKIGIGQDIANYLKENQNCAHSLTLIRKALSMYTNHFRYLSASQKAGNVRIDLTGNDAGIVTPEQAEYAQTKLIALNNRKKYADHHEQQ